MLTEIFEVKNLEKTSFQLGITRFLIAQQYNGIYYCAQVFVCEFRLIMCAIKSSTLHKMCCNMHVKNF